MVHKIPKHKKPYKFKQFIGFSLFQGFLNSIGKLLQQFSQ